MELILGPSLSVTAAPLAQAAGGDIKRAIAQIGRSDVHQVQLSAAQRGIRPRELDHRARRDVLAMLSRHGLMLSGLDLMIPPNDWTDPSRQSKAVEATLAAIDLAADLGRVPLCMPLPMDTLAGDIRKTLLTSLDGRGVTLAVHAEDQLDKLTRWLKDEDLPTLKAAVDPAALLAAGVDPSDAVMTLSDHLHTARLDDYARVSVAASGGRCPVGHGELDLTAYRAALSTIEKLHGLIIELRDVGDPAAAMQTAIDMW